MFTSLLIQTCDIQEKTPTQTGYEKVNAWANISTAIPYRKDSSNSPSISDSDIRINSDDDLFFFNPDVSIIRGNRIVLDSENYDVVKVNKVLGSTTVHHLEVVARLVDND